MEIENIQIKETSSDDLDDILEVERIGFGYDKEAELVDLMLKDSSGEPIVSLLAYYNNEAVGHILFTRATLDGKEDSPLFHILAPMAVKPDFQKKGIGGLLINEGLARLKKMGSKMVLVLGHMEYYPRYGFIPDAESLGLKAPYPIPPEYANAWMVQTLEPDGVLSIKGKIKCSDELNQPQHWRDDESDR